MIDRLPNDLYNRIIEKKKTLDSQGKLSSEIIKRIDKRMEIEFIYNTNKIEGNALSRGETELVLRGLTVKNQNLSDILEIQNHPSGLDLVRKMAFDVQHKIDEDDIKEVHKMIMNGVIANAGEYRMVDLQVTGAGFTPPPFYEVPRYMNNLIELINDNKNDLRPIELAAYVHYDLSWIHPFENGNGRLARLLMNFILLKNGYPCVIIPKVERGQYLENLRIADKESFEPFLIYIARRVEQTLDIYLLEIENPDVDKPELLTLNELSKDTSHSAEYWSLLARKGKIDAVKIGKVWKTTKKTIENYLQQHSEKPIPQLQTNN
jgi:Fic family protein